LVNERSVRSFFAVCPRAKAKLRPGNSSNERLIAGGRLTPAWRPFAYLRPANFIL
jgi:hypothetical protein